MEKTTYLEHMQLLDEADVFANYFLSLHSLLYNSHDFDMQEYNKMCIILSKIVNDVKS